MKTNCTIHENSFKIVQGFNLHVFAVCFLLCFVNLFIYLIYYVRLKNCLPFPLPCCLIYGGEIFHMWAVWYAVCNH